MKTLTPEQQIFAAQNHNVIYSFMQQKNLLVEEYYDICAIGFCKAVANFDSKNAAFTTYAYFCMNNEVKYHWRTISSLKRINDAQIVSYNSTFESNNETEVSYENFISAPDFSQNLIEDLDFYHFLKKISSRDAKIIQLTLQGWKQKELAKRYNISQGTISRIIKKVMMEYTETALLGNS